MSKVIERSALVNFSAQQMFDLVNDVEAYPGYMAGCVKAEVLERGADSITARLELAKSGIHQSFTTRNQLKPPNTMIMELVDGPFKKFRGIWQFNSLNANSCEVKFRLEYEFSNFFLGMAAGSMINQLAGEQVDSVCKRAKFIYGQTPT
jgi:ribosome-associated toxin RatA of RatAB toxin-antitoxin module